MQTEPCIFTVDKINLENFDKSGEKKSIYYYDSINKKIVEITNESFKVFNKKGTRLLIDIPINLSDKVKAVSVDCEINLALLLFSSSSSSSNSKIENNNSKIYMLDLIEGLIVGDFTIKENLEFLLDFFFLGNTNQICLIFCDKICVYGFHKERGGIEVGGGYSLKMEKIFYYEPNKPYLFSSYSYCPKRKFLALLSNSSYKKFSLNKISFFDLRKSKKIIISEENEEEDEEEEKIISSSSSSNNRIKIFNIKKCFDSLDYYTTSQILLSSVYNSLLLFVLSLTENKVRVYDLDSSSISFKCKKIFEIEISGHGNFAGIQIVDNLFIIHSFFKRSFVAIDLFNVLYKGVMKYRNDVQIMRSWDMKDSSLSINNNNNRKSFSHESNNNTHNFLKRTNTTSPYATTIISNNNIITPNKNSENIFEPILNISSLQNFYESEAFFITGEYLAKRNKGMRGGELYFLKFNPEKYKDLVKFINTKKKKNENIQEKGIVKRIYGLKYIPDCEMLINLFHRKNCKLITVKSFFDSLFTSHLSQNDSINLNITQMILFTKHLINLEKIVYNERIFDIDFSKYPDISQNLKQKILTKYKFMYLRRHYIQQSDIFLDFIKYLNQIMKENITDNKNVINDENTNKINDNIINNQINLEKKNNYDQILYNFLFFGFYYYASLIEDIGEKIISPTFFNFIHAIVEKIQNINILYSFLNYSEFFKNVDIANIFIKEKENIFKQIGRYLLIQLRTNTSISIEYLLNHFIQTKNISYFVSILHNNIFSKEKDLIKKILLSNLHNNNSLKKNLIELLL